MKGIFAALLILTVLGGTSYIIYTQTSVGEKINSIRARIAEYLATRKSFTLDRAEIPVSGTTAIDITPIPGVHITAPENALDKQRQFVVNRLSDAQLTTAARTMNLKESVPLLGFNIDAGMTKDELFPGTATLRFNLKELGIPKELWNNLSILHLDQDNQARPLVSTFEDEELKGEIRHNYWFLITMTTGIGLGVIRVFENHRKFGSESYVNDRFLDYDIYWPSTWEPRNKAEIAKMNNRINAVCQRMGWLWSDPDKKYLAPCYHILDAWGIARCVMKEVKALEADPEYQDIEKTQNDLTWKKENYYPYTVVHMLNSIEHAHEYLFKERHFNKPTYIMDIVARSPWPHGTALGISEDLVTTYPYVLLNGDSGDIPFNEKSENFYKSGQSLFVDGIDMLNLIVVHEMFHVVQKEYVMINMDINTWFCEATAVVLENEAKKYYVDKSWNKGGETTDRDFWETFQIPMPEMPEHLNEKVAQNHGYTASQFLEFLRDNYYGRNPDDFLFKVMLDFSKFFSGSVTALYRQTSNNQKLLGADFLMFCVQNAARMFKEIKPKINTPPDLSADYEVYNKLFYSMSYELTADKPLLKEDRKWRALTCSFKKITFPNIDDVKLKEAVVVIEPHKKEYYKDQVIEDVNVRWSSNGTDWKTIINDALAVEAKTNKESYLQDIEAYTFDSGRFSTRWDQMSVYLMLPQKAPEVTSNEDTMTIRIEPGILAKEKKIKGYQIIIEPPFGGKPVTIKTEDTEAEVQMKDIETAVAESKTKLGKWLDELNEVNELVAKRVFGTADKNQKSKYVYRITYREVADTENEILGPPSEPTDLDLNLKLNPTIIGTWEGNIWFMGDTLTLIAEPGEKGFDAKITMTITSDSERLEFLSNYNKDKNAYELYQNLFDPKNPVKISQDWMYILYLMPGDRIFIPAPPALLKRTSKK